MHIKTASFKFRLKAVEPLILPSYKGSTLRGGFGYTFRRVVCALRDRECPDCLLKEKCVYSYIFETTPPSDTKIMRKYKSAPHPFVIEPPPERRRGYKTGDEINFGLILIGRAIDYLPYFIYTFDELGRIGIGKGKGRYELKTVKCENNPVIPAKPVPCIKYGADSAVFKQGAGIQTIYDSETKTLKPFMLSRLSIEIDSSDSKIPDSKPLTLNFLTPTRIYYNGHLTIDLEFHIFIRNLLRRLSLLYYFHCGGDPSEFDFMGLIKKAQEVEVIKRDLKWYDWERYSARQDARLKMGGFVGEITFEGNIEPFMPLIKAGEVLHVGKGTSFGLGKYAIIDLTNKK